MNRYRNAWLFLALMGAMFGLLGPKAHAAPTDNQVAVFETNLPSQVTITNSKGQRWVSMVYGTDAYEYYSVYNFNRYVGSLRSDRQHHYRLSGPEHWSLHGRGDGFWLYDGWGRPVARVQRWFKFPQPEPTAKSTAGISGDWKVTNTKGKVLYYLENVEPGYNVLDSRFHIVSIVKPTEKGITVTDNKTGKLRYIVRGTNSGLFAACLSMNAFSPWARITVGSYFFPDWW